MQRGDAVAEEGAGVTIGAGAGMHRQVRLAAMLGEGVGHTADGVGAAGGKVRAAVAVEVHHPAADADHDLLGYAPALGFDMGRQAYIQARQSG